MSDQRKRIQRLRLVILVLFGALLASGGYSFNIYRASQQAQAEAMDAAGDARRLAELLTEAQARCDALEEKYLELQARLKEIEQSEGGPPSRATMQQTLEEVEALLEPIKDLIKDDRLLGGPPTPAQWSELTRKKQF